MSYVWKILVIVAGVILIAYVPNLFWIPATAQNESAFIRTYDPVPVLKSLRSTCGPGGRNSGPFTQISGGRADGAGYLFLKSRKDVEHHLSVEVRFCADTQYNAALLAALHEDVLLALRKDACLVSGDDLASDRGVQIHYRCGPRSSGVVSAKPPQAHSPEDPAHASLIIHIDEQWAVRRL